MNSQLNFMIKVVGISVGLSFLIKYGGRLLPIAPTTTNALLGISLPPLVLALILAWRGRRQNGGENQ